MYHSTYLYYPYNALIIILNEVVKYTVYDYFILIKFPFQKSNYFHSVDRAEYVPTIFQTKYFTFKKLRARCNKQATLIQSKRKLFIVQLTTCYILNKVFEFHTKHEHLIHFNPYFTLVYDMIYCH